MTKRVMIATAMTATLALSACMEPSYLNSGSGGYQTQPADPYARTKSGAVIGGVLGGVVGAAAADKDERAKGALIGAVIDLTVIWRLFDRPRVMLLVATVGLSQLMLGANLALPDVDTDAAQIRFPAAIGRSWDDIVGLTPTGPQVQIRIAVPAVITSSITRARPSSGAPTSQPPSPCSLASLRWNAQGRSRPWCSASATDTAATSGMPL